MSVPLDTVTPVIRRNQQDRRAERQAARDAERQSELLEGSYRTPPRDKCVEKEHEKILDDEDTIRLQTRFWRKDGNTTEFVLVIRQREWDSWRNGPRIDCCHGMCHVHLDDDAPPSKSLMTLDTVRDVEEAMAAAIDEITWIADALHAQGEGGFNG